MIPCYKCCRKTRLFCVSGAPLKVYERKVLQDRFLMLCIFFHLTGQVSFSLKCQYLIEGALSLILIIFPTFFYPFYQSPCPFLNFPSSPCSHLSPHSLCSMIIHVPLLKYHSSSFFSKNIEKSCMKNYFFLNVCRPHFPRYRLPRDFLSKNYRIIGRFCNKL